MLPLSFQPMSAKHFDIFRTLLGFGIFIILIFLYYNFDGTFIRSQWIKIPLLSGLICSVFFSLDCFRKPAALIMIVTIVVIAQTNPYAIRVVHGYITWILFATLFIPSGEGSFLRKKASSSKWTLPYSVQLPILLVLAASISFSGISKMLTPLWYNGTAMELFMENPRFNWILAKYLNEIPYFSHASTYAVFIIEAAFFPFYLIPKTRFIAWLVLLLLLIGFFVLMHIYIVAMIMLIILYFLYPLPIGPSRA